MIEIYTDGSTLKNGAKDAEGGFGVVVIKDGKIIKAHSARCSATTNNREEMKAIIWAAYMYGDYSSTPVVYSDSSYSVNSFNQWMNNWKANGWKKADKKTPENLDLIKLYDIIKNKQNKKIDLRYIKGHAGHIGNELADRLATGQIKPEDIEGRELIG